MEGTKINEGWVYYLEGSKEKQMVTLPHDAMLHTGREADSEGKDANGYYLGGIYHYEKDLEVPADWENKTAILSFGGVYRNTSVYVNGEKAGYRPYGYIPFEVCLDGFLKYGAANHIEVVADNSMLPNSRWYSDGGIYRNVELYLADKEHIEFQGVRITTLSTEPAVVCVDTAVATNDPAVEVLVAIKDGEDIVANGQGTKTEIEVPGAILWDTECPKLYQCIVTLTKNGRILDTAKEWFGIRSVSWNNNGLFINGKETLLKGACIHHDNGLLGACSYQEAEDRKIRILKENGYNAIRIAHNPASKELLQACDKQGMFVMDETFDMWFSCKNKYDYGNDFNDWYIEDTAAMVKRDYNHPSVIMYSVGNEVSEPAKEEGIQAAKNMVAAIREIDASRAVTAGVNFLILLMSASGKGLYDDGGLAKQNSEPKHDKKKQQKDTANGSLIFNTIMSVMGKGINRIGNSKKADAATTRFADLLDIAGYNYANGRYKKEGKIHPGRIIVGSETYPQDIANNWEMVEKLPYIVGDFMWTGWDYMGEAAIGAWNYEGVNMGNVRYPWLLSGAGTIDILGRADASAKYAAVVWGDKKPYIGVYPLNHPGIRVTKSAWRGSNAILSWSWQGCTGNRTQVEVFANGTDAELLINGKSQGKKKLKKKKAVFKVTYEPGKIEAIIRDKDEKEISRTELHTAKSPRLHIRVESDVAYQGGISYFDITISDENGVIESNADQKIRISVENGEVLGFGSADPAPIYDYLSYDTKTFYGHAQAIVRALNPGVVRVTVTSDGRQTAQAQVTVC